MGLWLHCASVSLFLCSFVSLRFTWFTGSLCLSAVPSGSPTLVFGFIIRTCVRGSAPRLDRAELFSGLSQHFVRYPGPWVFSDPLRLFVVWTWDLGSLV